LRLLVRLAELDRMDEEMDEDVKQAMQIEISELEMEI